MPSEFPGIVSSPSSSSSRLAVCPDEIWARETDVFHLLRSGTRLLIDWGRNWKDPITKFSGMKEIERTRDIRGLQVVYPL